MQVCKDTLSCGRISITAEFDFDFEWDVSDVSDEGKPKLSIARTSQSAKNVLVSEKGRVQSSDFFKFGIIDSTSLILPELVNSSEIDSNEDEDESLATIREVPSLYELTARK